MDVTNLNKIITDLENESEKLKSVTEMYTQLTVLKEEIGAISNNIEFAKDTIKTSLAAFDENSKKIVNSIDEIKIANKSSEENAEKNRIIFKESLESLHEKEGTAHSGLEDIKRSITDLTEKNKQEFDVIKRSFEDLQKREEDILNKVNLIDNNLKETSDNNKKHFKISLGVSIFISVVALVNLIVSIVI